VGGPLKGDGSGNNHRDAVEAARGLGACTVATVEDGSWRNVNEYLDRAVELERASAVLVYVVPPDARAYAVLVHASAYASAGRHVVMIMSDVVDQEAVPGLSSEREKTDVERARKYLLQEISSMPDRSCVHVYKCSQVQKAVQHAHSIAVNLRMAGGANLSPTLPLSPTSRSKLALSRAASPRAIGNAVKSFSTYSMSVLKRQSANRPASSSPSVSSVVRS
jgi:hypothetical protein